jgi:diaminopimelate epimerase
MGNPHAILFVDDLDIDITRIGPLIEKHPFFPKKTNVEFVELIDRSNINMRVWERGVGETLGCGTGSSAAAVACYLNNLTDSRVSVHLKGGSLDIEIKEDLRVLMTGPSEYTFYGKLSSSFTKEFF